MRQQKQQHSHHQGQHQQQQHMSPQLTIVKMDAVVTNGVDQQQQVVSPNVQGQGQGAGEARNPVEYLAELLLEHGRLQTINNFLNPTSPTQSAPLKVAERLVNEGMLTSLNVVPH
jgi:hypothetical protein